MALQATIPYSMSAALYEGLFWIKRKIHVRFLSFMFTAWWYPFSGSEAENRMSWFSHIGSSCDHTMLEDYRTMQVHYIYLSAGEEIDQKRKKARSCFAWSKRGRRRYWMCYWQSQTMKQILRSQLWSRDLSSSGSQKLLKAAVDYRWASNTSPPAKKIERCG